VFVSFCRRAGSTTENKQMAAKKLHR